MCVAIATGLFDSGINYVWNLAIVELRDKVRRFGIAVIPQIIDAGFDEKTLLDLKDAELLDLCLKLNLISEDGFFKLNQCRDIRNNFSAAHPTIGDLDEDELIIFISRCGRYALSERYNPKGVDIQALIKAVKGGKFSKKQLEAWRDRVSETFEAQRELLFGMLHGIYCDPSSGEEARLNAILLCEEFAETFSPKTNSSLIVRHQDYLAQGEDKRHRASQKFFENLEIITILSESERHAMISSACKKLISVHSAFDNFYNEPAFAERLDSLTTQQDVPATAQEEYVESVVTCAVGNPYGISNAAFPHYKNMIQSFSPKEIRLMLKLPRTRTQVANRIRLVPDCKSRFKKAVALIDPSSIPTAAKSAYAKWKK